VRVEKVEDGLELVVVGSEAPTEGG
jgi:hypothetical protein